MKKLTKLLLAIMLALSVGLTAVGCATGGENPGGENPGGENPGGNNPGGGNEPITATIDFYTTVNVVEQSALQQVANAYSDLQYENGNNITVMVRNNTDPSAYTQTVRNLLANGVSNPTIANTSVAPEYYDSGKILDLSGYLEEPNEYIEGNTAWMNALEEDAYRSRQTGASSIVPGLSYSSNYTTVYYNKAAMRSVLGDDPIVAEDGTIDNTKITWEWFMNALETAQNSGQNFDYPLGVSTSTQSFGTDSFTIGSTIIDTYLDQYFRDFLEEVHSQEGDYSYISSIDSVWEYDTENATLDLPNVYTYNMNRVVDTFFNQEGYNPLSDRYEELMENLYEFFSYADPEASYNDVFNRFNETVITYEEKGGTYDDMKLFYVEDLTYIRTYRDAFKTTNSNGATVYPTASEIADELGWFILPAMDSDLEGVADNVRPNGGPSENYGVLSTGEQSLDEIAVDFLRYLFSPDGQSAIYASYEASNYAPINMRQLVKNVTIPESIDYTGLIDVEGDCSNNPYRIFGKGTGLTTITVGSSGEYVTDQIASLLSGYFRGSNSDWAAQAQSMFDILCSGFADYANENNFIYTDYSQAASATNNLVNSPYSSIS
nr:hypothetical protein [uncultured Merdimonas sp.]